MPLDAVWSSYCQCRNTSPSEVRGTRQRSWFRHYATNWKVVASIPDVIGFFYWPNSFSRTIALGSNQPLTEMSTRNLPGGRVRPARKADVTAICEPIVYKMWEPRRVTTLWASTACYNIHERKLWGWEKIYLEIFTDIHTWSPWIRKRSGFWYAFCLYTWMYVPQVGTRTVWWILFTFNILSQVGARWIWIPFVQKLTHLRWVPKSKMAI
jgi:hypothetical protein